MNELTLRGTICKNIDHGYGRENGTPHLTFTVRIPPKRFYDRQSGQWTDRGNPVFQKVVAYNAQAENAFDWIAPSLRVVVIGTLEDDSYTKQAGGPDGEDVRITRTQLLADEIAAASSNARLTVTPIRQENNAPDAATG